MPGPIALFDKSFIQSLNVDESVWFDHFFMAVVCPIFFVETLADLAKEPRKGKTSEAEVRFIASKFPEMHGCPCVDYLEMSLSNLMGHDLPMDGRIIRPGGRPVRGGGRTGIVYDQSPEEAAFQRWQNEKFVELEREFARKWRAELNAIDLKQIGSAFQAKGVNPKSCRTLTEAHQLATQIVSADDGKSTQIALAINLLRVPHEYHSAIAGRWQRVGKPSLISFAPYTAFVVTVETFFQVALAAQLIPDNRNSNRTDIAYLFYLPFCHVFISSDRLHRRTAELFLRPDQEFIWGQDLKADLGKINAHFSQRSDAERESGIMCMAQYPPGEAASLVAGIWKRFGFGSRPHADNLAEKVDGDEQRRILAELQEFNHGTTIDDELTPDEVEAVSVRRVMHKKKGSWWQLPKELKVDGDELE